MDRLLIKISNYLAIAANLDGDQEEVILYALRLIYSGIGGFVFIVILSWLVGVLPYALLGAITNAFLRVRAGGAHASFPISCFTIGAIVFTGIGLIAKYTPVADWDYLFLILLIPIYLITLWALMKYAPADTPAKPLSNERKIVLKMKSIRGHLFLFIIITALSLSLRIENPLSNWLTQKHLFSALLGIIWEVLTITPFGFLMLGVLDGTMVKIFRTVSFVELD